ncbi:Thiol-disulfide isomerase or thioredoxin [Lampropedia hyalina DSM 16112]|jgi:thiol-disulfide isomerase/thioredoxin|uniref:Thiol-disulfide isomerase or thioredoxin n=1 Tax=Lampropedia hyalina DSM 16112 TaxID=1122156 RepID=A0A1M4VSS6_9BURK|nr:TlpA disulfide reductase family protein [Lampropedia hyalina]SHE72086.1 Thiol-disulfide isomerase or thioredoxin [Lampropedia hyalina DSM 16112]
MTHMPHATPADTAAFAHSNRRQWLRHLAQASAVLSMGMGMPVWQAAASTPAGNSTDAFWQAELPGLDGQPQPLNAYRGKPLLVNFWASWCAPCVKELPLLNTFHHALPTGEWQVLGIAVDTASNIQRFLQRTSVDFPTLVAGSAGLQLSRGLGNTSGGLPFTVVFDSSGQVIERVSGLVEEGQLQQWRATVR